MGAIRVNVTVEVEQTGNGLTVQRPVPIQLVHEDGTWRAECQEPCLETASHERFEQALMDGARCAQQKLQAQVEERPLIVGRITPDMVRAHFGG